jgi:putative ABC transport system permease protein
MAVRERRAEVAVLKTLGFSSGLVMALIVAEALLIGALGGTLGVGGSQGILSALGRIPEAREFLAGPRLSGLGLRPGVAAMGFAVALLLSLFAGLAPDWGAYRARITDRLRPV